LLGRSDYAIIGELIEPNTRVLDLGCGEGELLAWLAANKNVDARGVEISGPKVQQGHRPRRFRISQRSRSGAGRSPGPGLRLRDPEPDPAGDARIPLKVLRGCCA
jgi:SAM-dependent methyltransferase